MHERNKKLKDRVVRCRTTLNALKIKQPLDKFARKYPRYIQGENEEAKLKAKTRLRNLFYSKAFDEEFTNHLEVFTQQTKNKK